MNLPQLSNSPIDWSSVLASVLAEFQCVTGTLHQLSAETGQLHLLAQQGIPPFLLDKINQIPVGKGIAGCAAERQEAVQMCNLQQDASGVARPDAKMTRVEGALAVPIFAEGEKRTVGVLGIGKMEPYEFCSTETEALEAVAKQIAAALPA